MQRQATLLLLTLALAAPVAPADTGAPGKAHDPGAGKGRGGMPAELRETIHGLFHGHASITRELTATETGYRSTTTSTDPAVAALLQKHVQQMEERLGSGLMVRRWDPAFTEFVNHYEDIEIAITPVDGGISVAVTGKTEGARKVARNHASIISRFVQNGWAEHDKTHPTVLGEPAGSPPAGQPHPHTSGTGQEDREAAAAAQTGAGDGVPAKGSDPQSQPGSCPECHAGADAGSSTAPCCGKIRSEPR